jgi:rubredoxin
METGIRWGDFKQLARCVSKPEESFARTVIADARFLLERLPPERIIGIFAEENGQERCRECGGKMKYNEIFDRWECAECSGCQEDLSRKGMEASNEDA